MKKEHQIFSVFLQHFASFTENKHIRADLAGFYEVWKLTCSQEIKLTSSVPWPCSANLCAAAVIYKL